MENINALDKDEVSAKELPLRRCAVKSGKVDPEDLEMFPFRASRRSPRTVFQVDQRIITSG